MKPNPSKKKKRDCSNQEDQASPRSDKIFKTNGDATEIFNDDSPIALRNKISRISEKNTKMADRQNESLFNADLSSISNLDKTGKSPVNSSQLDMWRKALNHSREFSPMGDINIRSNQREVSRGRLKRSSSKLKDQSSQFIVLPSRSSYENSRVSSASKKVAQR